MTRTSRERWHADLMRRLTLGIWIVALALGSIVLILEVAG